MADSMDPEAQSLHALRIEHQRLAEELHRAERALAESEARYRTLFEQSLDGILLTTPDGRILAANPAACHILGRTEAEICQAGRNGVLDARDPRLAVALDERARTGKFVGELTAKRPDGTLFPIEVASAVFCDHQGQPRTCILLRDISARKQAESALHSAQAALAQQVRERTAALSETNTLLSAEIAKRRQAEEACRLSEERFAKAFRANPDVLVISRLADGCILEVSESWQSLFGYSPEEVIGQSSLALNLFADPWDRERAIAQLQAHGAVRDFELDIRRRSGEVRHASLAVEQIDVKGEACMLTIIHDVTARKRAEAEVWRLNVELEQRVHDRTAQLAAANQELEAFSYSVSHDLRKPLHLMQGFTELLLGEYTAQLPAEAVHYLHRIHANVQQMGQLITALLSLSDLSRQALTKERIQPVDLVQRILADLRTEREGRHVEIVLGELPPCDADPVLLKQVWVNLLTNALKFTRPRERARLEIGSRQTEGRCVYFVGDNGVGFDMRDAANLFGVFQRLPGAQAYEGTGIGLSIVRRIIERHGGQVWAEAAVNHGATFFFTLPGSPP